MKTKYIVCLNIRKIELTDDQVDELYEMDHTKDGAFILDVCDAKEKAVDSLYKAVDSFDTYNLKGV